MLHITTGHEGLRRNKSAASHPRVLHAACDPQSIASSTSSGVPASPHIRKGIQETKLMDVLVAAAEVCEKADLSSKSDQNPGDIAIDATEASPEKKLMHPSIHIDFAKRPEPPVVIRVAPGSPSLGASDSGKRKAASEDEATTSRNHLQPLKRQRNKIDQVSEPPKPMTPTGLLASFAPTNDDAGNMVPLVKTLLQEAISSRLLNMVSAQETWRQQQAIANDMQNQQVGPAPYFGGSRVSPPRPQVAVLPQAAHPSGQHAGPAVPLMTAKLLIYKYAQTLGWRILGDMPLVPRK